MSNSLSHSVKTRKKRLSPVSLRLSEEQRAELHRRAGNLALSSYIKRVLFDADAPLSRAVPTRVSADQAELAKLLAWLGRTEVAAHLAVMAEATKSGSLVVNPIVAAQLNKACSDIAAIRAALMRAMGKQTDGTSVPVKKRRISAAEFKALSQPHSQRSIPKKKMTDEEALRAFDESIKAWRAQR